MNLLISVFIFALASASHCKVITPAIRYQLGLELQLWTSVSESSYFTVESDRIPYAKCALKPPYKYDIGNFTSSNITMISSPITFIWNQIPVSNAAIEVEKLVLSEDAYLNNMRLITNFRYFEPVKNEIWTRKPMKFYRISYQDKIMKCILSVTLKFLDSEADYVNSFSANISLLISNDLNYTLTGIWMTKKDINIAEKISEFAFSVKGLMKDKIKLSWNGDIYQKLRIASVIFDEQCNDKSTVTLTYKPLSVIELPPYGEQVLIRMTPGATPTEMPGMETTMEDFSTLNEDATEELTTYSELTTVTDPNTIFESTVITDILTTSTQTSMTSIDMTTAPSFAVKEPTTDENGFNIDDDPNDQRLEMEVSSGHIIFTRSIQLPVKFINIILIHSYIRG